MSFIVFAIGAAHALPPVIGAAITKSKTGGVIGAAIAVLIAVAFGNSAFIATDLIGIGIGTWLAFSIVQDKSTN